MRKVLCDHAELASDVAVPSTSSDFNPGSLCETAMSAETLDLHHLPNCREPLACRLPADQSGDLGVIDLRDGATAAAYEELPDV